MLYVACKSVQLCSVVGLPGYSLCCAASFLDPHNDSRVTEIYLIFSLSLRFFSSSVSLSHSFCLPELDNSLPLISQVQIALSLSEAFFPAFLFVSLLLFLACLYLFSLFFPPLILACMLLPEPVLLFIQNIIVPTHTTYPLALNLRVIARTTQRHTLFVLNITAVVACP